MSEHTWPGSDDKPVVMEMRENPDSPHWGQCNIWISRLVSLCDAAEHLKPDIAQEAMIAVHKNLSKFRFGCRLTTWLTRIVNSKKHDAMRRELRKKRHAEISLDELRSDADNNELFEAPAPLTTEEECILREKLRETSRKLQEEYNRYSKKNNAERNKEIIKRHFQDEQKYSDIAADLGVDAQTVADICKRVQRSLRKDR